MGTDLIIGVDLDNTIICYEEVLFMLASERDLITSDTPKNKKIIRDRIRELPSGELKWRELQALAYGPLIREASPARGVWDFFRICRERGIKAYIVSHKTEYADKFDTGVNLRAAAMEWLRSKGFIDTGGLALTEGDIYFESSRRDKVMRIEKLRCSMYIDDLEETFREPSFPKGVAKILFDPEEPAVFTHDLKRFASWDHICRYVFSALQ